MRRSTLLVSLLTLCLILLVGCGPQPDPECASRITSPGDYHNSCGLGVPGGAQQAELTLQVELSQGALSWTLLDPQGVVRWEGQSAAGETLDLSRTFQNPSPGRWNLEIELQGAAGEYRAPWSVQEAESE